MFVMFEKYANGWLFLTKPFEIRAARSLLFIWRQQRTLSVKRWVLSPCPATKTRVQACEKAAQHYGPGATTVRNGPLFLTQGPSPADSGQSIDVFEALVS